MFCASAEQALDSLDGLYGDSIAIVSYNHTFGNLAVINLRDSLYSTPVYPTAVFDGTDEVFELDPNLFITTYTAHIMAAKADTPSYNLDITATATPTAGDIAITIVTADTIPAGQMIAYAAVCQDSIRGFTRDFNYVVQEMFSIPLDLAYPDTLDTVITFSHALPVDKMRAVVFVQNMDTKKVMGSIIRHFEEVE